MGNEKATQTRKGMVLMGINTLVKPVLEDKTQT